MCRRSRRLSGLGVRWKPPAGAGTLCAAGFLILASTAVVACGGAPPSDSTAETSAPEATPAPEELRPRTEEAAIRFVDVTEPSGVDWVHNTGAFGKRWMPETIGPGVVVLDADGDERLDLLFVNGRNFAGYPGQATTSALFLNQGGLTFVEATEEAGLDFSAYCLGGVAGDVDNDGDSDVFLACLGQDLLLRNDGGRFVDVSRQSGLSQEFEFGAAGVFFDADRDGYLDIYVTRYVTWSPEGDLFCSYDGEVKSYCTPMLYQGASPRYYRNRGDGTFEDRTETAGFYLPTAKMLGVASLDVDGDGWPDLAVAGDTHPNLLYVNQGGGFFEEAGILSGMAVGLYGGAGAGMGVDVGDYNRNGRPSVAITYFSNERVGVYRNEGNVFLLNVSQTISIGPRTFFTLGWGCFFFDYDLDGWLDFFVANGHLDDQIEKISDTISYAQPQQLFRNLGNGDFLEVTEHHDLARPLVARGAAYGDLDDDGDLDLVLTTNAGPAKVFENRGEGYGNWLRLSLEGTASNRDALGAHIEVTAGDAVQTWYVHSGGSYLSHSQVDAVFGLGDAQLVDRVVIRWPSGTVQELTQVAVNQRLAVLEEPASNEL